MNGNTSEVSNSNVVASHEKKQLSIETRTRSWQEEVASKDIDVPGTPRPRKNTQQGKIRI